MPIQQHTTDPGGKQGRPGIRRDPALRDHWQIGQRPQTLHQQENRFGPDVAARLKPLGDQTIGPRHLRQTRRKIRRFMQFDQNLAGGPMRLGRGNRTVKRCKVRRNKDHTSRNRPGDQSRMRCNRRKIVLPQLQTPLPLGRTTHRLDQGFQRLPGVATIDLRKFKIKNPDMPATRCRNCNPR